jgi:polysaccharide export outer membrane protein
MIEASVRFIKGKLALLLLLWLAVGCGPTRNLVYFSDLASSDDYKVKVENNHELRIGVGDLLSIDLQSMNPESNALFNRSQRSPGDTKEQTTTGATGALRQDYLVDAEGTIDYPVVGKIKLAGLTKSQAADKLKGQVQTYVKDPIIDIRLLNFKITVIGEVNKPSTFTVPAEQINVLEALGLAGDLTAYGKRENVLLIREKDGVRSTTRLNLNQKEVLMSPYFYLQQNDVLYVEPDKQREIQASTNTRTLTIVTVATSVLVAVILNFKNIF